MQMTRFLAPVASPGATVFGVMFLFDSMSRAFLVSLIPLVAYDLLRSERDVTLLYFTVGVLGLASTLLIPWLMQHMRRKWIYTMGCIAYMAMGVLIATATLSGLVTGMWLRVTGSAALYTTLNLYIMDYIQKRELVRSEPMRLLFGGIGWIVGPAAGVYVSQRLGVPAACAIASLCAIVLLIYFWVLRLKDNPAVAPATRPPPSVAYNLRRFFAQPRMRLAYAIAFVRSIWWSMFYIYTPLFMVKAGYEPSTAALVVSMGNLALLFSLAYGRAARRVGVRPVIVVSFLLGGALTLLVALTAGVPLLAASLLVVGALVISALDALGGIAFLRAVHAYERAEMATVYSTYRQITDISGPMIFAVVLTFLPLPAVFAASGLAMLVMARVAMYLPRGL